MVVMNILTHERYRPPRGEYELMISDDGTNAMLVGMTTGGDQIMMSDTDTLSKFAHVVGTDQYIYDVNSGKHSMLSTMNSRHRVVSLASLASPSLPCQVGQLAKE